MLGLVDIIQYVGKRLFRETAMASMTDKDYYAILGVSSDASTDDIRKSFQKLARTYHPDINKEPGAEEKFKEISEAYAVLSDPEKRKRYDAMRSGAPFGGYGPTGTSGGYGTGYTDPFGGMPFDMWGFPFTGSASRGTATRSRAYNPRPGADIAFELELDAAKARAGTTRGVTYQRYVTCDHCHGVGSVRSEQAVACPTCGGKGRITIDMSGIFGFGVMDVECPECEGTGKVVAEPCEACGGSGRILSADEIVVNVPENSHDGDEVRVKGKGNAGTNGSESGDFVCRVGVRSERLAPLQRHGFEMVGFVIPFVIVPLITGGAASVGIFTIIVGIIGAYFGLRDGIKHDLGWWRNAGRAILSGASTGLMWAIFTYLLFSCSFGYGMR